MTDRVEEPAPNFKLSMNERCTYMLSQCKDRFSLPLAALFYLLSITTPCWILIPNEGFVSLWNVFGTKFYYFIWLNQLFVILGVSSFFSYFIFTFLFNLKCCKCWTDCVSCSCCCNLCPCCMKIDYSFIFQVLGVVFSIPIFIMDSCKPQLPCFSFYCYIFALTLFIYDYCMRRLNSRSEETEDIKSEELGTEHCEDSDIEAVITPQIPYGNLEKPHEQENGLKTVDIGYFWVILVIFLAIFCWQITVMAQNGQYVPRKYDDIFLSVDLMDGITVKNIVTSPAEQQWIKEFQMLRKNHKFNIGFVLSHAFYIWDHMGPMMSICEDCKIFYCEEIINKHRNEHERLIEAKKFGFKVEEVTLKELLAWTEEKDQKNILFHMGLDELDGKKNVEKTLTHGIDEDAYVHGPSLWIEPSYEDRNTVNKIVMVWSKRWLSFRQKIHENMTKKIKSLSNGKKILVRFATWCPKWDTCREKVLPEIKKFHEDLEDKYQIFYKTHPITFKEFPRLKMQDFVVCNCYPKDTEIKISADAVGLSVLEWTEIADVIISTSGSTQISLAKFTTKPFIYNPQHPREPFYNRREADSWIWENRMLNSRNVNVMIDFEDLETHVKASTIAANDSDMQQKRKKYMTNMFGDKVNGYGEYQYLMNLIKEKVDADITSLEDICKTFKDWGKEIWN